MAVVGIDAFKSKLTGGGARANLFQVTLNFPGYAGGSSELASFMVKAASLPASTIGKIEIPFRGRVLKIAGDRTFDVWNTTIINDVNMPIRNAIERWMNGINNHVANTGRSNPRDYQVDLKVDQLDKGGNVTKSYIIRSAFPTSCGAIELSNDTNDAIQEFPVTFEYQYWESSTTPSSGSGGLSVGGSFSVGGVTIGGSIGI